MRRPVAALATDSGRVICETCVVADNPLARLRGLLGKRSLPPGEGLLLRPAPSIHTFFMRFPIDVVFLDSDLQVLRVLDSVRPWRAAACRRARAVLELGAGEAAARRISPGDRLRLEEGR